MVVTVLTVHLLPGFPGEGIALHTHETDVYVMHGDEACHGVIAYDVITMVGTKGCGAGWVQLWRESWKVFLEENPVRCPVCFAGLSLETNKKIFYQIQDTMQIYYISMTFRKSHTAALFLNPHCLSNSEFVICQSSPKYS